MRTSGRRKVNGTSPEELLVRKLFQQLSKRTKLRFRPTEYDKDFVFTVRYHICQKKADFACY